MYMHSKLKVGKIYQHLVDKIAGQIQLRLGFSTSDGKKGSTCTFLWF